MKFAVVALAVLAVANAQFPRGFGAPSAFGAPSSFGGFAPAPARALPAPPQPRPQPVARVSADGRAANIVRLTNDVNPDGSFSYAFETDNGIAAQAQGTPKALGGNPPVAPDVIQGSFSWTSPEGQPIAISYIADENGYQPQGDALPTPPPIPEAILRSLDYNARNAPRQ